MISSTMAGCWSNPTTLSPKSSSIIIFISSQKHTQSIQFSNKKYSIQNSISSRHQKTVIFCSKSAVITQSETEYEDEDEEEEVEEDDFDDDGFKSHGGIMGSGGAVVAPPVRRRRSRYRKLYPGEKKGITEEMRFVAMKLHNSGKPKKDKKGVNKSPGSSEEHESEEVDSEDGNGETWQPSMEGLLKYLVDSKLVFSTIERIVDDSSDVSYAYFRKTGLERSQCLSKDLQWFSQEGNVIPEPSSPGVTYAKYLEELGEESPSLFLSHFYNIYFAHITGGQVITKKVSVKLLEGRELQFCIWEGEEQELLRSIREKLNAVGEHWTRDEKNKCLREATKAFRYLGQIVRLIIL